MNCNTTHYRANSSSVPGDPTHRAVANPGMMGGDPGELGRNSVRRKDGRIEILPGCAETHVEAGEAIEIATPTGGGWGKG